MRNRLTAFILTGMVLGVIVGFAANLWVGSDKTLAKDVAGYFHLLADIFLHLIKMIIAPLVFSTLVAGIAHMGDSAALGRIGGRALAWFVIASLISLTLGLMFVNFFAPGEGLNLVRSGVDSGVNTEALNFRDFILHVFPTSMVGAMADNSILQIVVFSLFVGVALTAIGEKGKPVVIVIESMVELMLQVTGYVMRVAPFAVFGALASVVTTEGLGVLVTFGELIGEFYIALGALWLLLFAAGSIFLGKRMFKLVRYVREPILIAFSTASSEAAYPKMLEQLDRFGVPRRIYSFVLPLGYSFNLDGSMMYSTFATIFIAQAYGIDLPIATQITILLVLMVTSKGIAAVPRASLVVVAATLGQFDLPVEGVAFILAVDHFMDMGRTATNVLGNAIATSVITKWEGMLEVEEPIDVPHPKAPAHTAAHGRAGLELAPDMLEEERKG
ncbi:MAG: dicarboxylate/amino acid:cation symporter [Sphingobium sp.]|uniref:dicarboxylate/amino acid:cation symporter n=1 Tax=Sphingobium sp. TaxID=1912891 RepID=UPI000C53D4A8|nr:dicarboxylate/amino acid:cation symporter [Sphingobium sp.]MBU0868628.1 dicarboxylate/amino acid:cation symporter [Alphaproteobacteria bacterium]MBA4755089.1 dicarboxylate/amino acid:cation symporter [Sphingobium sp.]MBS90218.1 dicarboxylate/amino acid:cation symporter [Sphingobium sp.]MBU1794321.1 dicarboxylate/amino acid:cation symporter [Alphaproteobacteria bacterium]MBU2015669.1 dicarboxylate/amino acid:cation symporter [Alphaproteobacteria bacterium]